MLTSKIVGYLTTIHEYKGKHHLIVERHADVLESLVEVLFEVSVLKPIFCIYFLLLEPIQQYYSTYNVPLDNYINSAIFRYRISKERSCYQDCVSNSYLGYMYAIVRCAYMGYKGEHVKNYIKRMIRVCVISSINASDIDGQICRENNMRVVYLDDDSKKQS